MDDVVFFESTAGVRVITDIRGGVTGVIGIDTASHTINLRLRQDRPAYRTLTLLAAPISLTVRPNEVWAVGIYNSTPPKLIRSAPFIPPHP